MVQLYRVFFTILFALAFSGLYAQNDDPCDANDFPIDFPPMNQTENVSGNIQDVEPFITSTSGGVPENFGTSGDSAVFIKLNLDPSASFLEIVWQDGSVDDLFVGLIGFDDPCVDPGEYVVTVYQNSDLENLISGDIEGGSVFFELCGLDPLVDYENLYLWIATSENGDFEIDINQLVRPDNDSCDEAEDIGLIEPGMTYELEDRSNQFACRDNFTGDPCATNANDGAGVWFQFETDNVVEMIDLIVEHDEEGDLDVIVFEPNPDCSNFIVVDGGCLNVTNGEAEFINLAVKRNTTYYIFVNTPEDDWGEFNLTLSTCDPPENHDVCLATEIIFPDLSHNPDNPIPGSPFSGTTECSYPFYDNNDQTAINEFDCTYDEQTAVFFKLNVDPDASKLTISGSVDDDSDIFAAQLIIFNDAPDCDERGFNALIAHTWGECDFDNNDLEIDLCEVDNDLYDFIYLMVATDRSNEGEFEIEIHQEIAPYNDECIEAGDIGTINHNGAIGNQAGCTLPPGWTPAQTNRGACEIDFVMPAGEPCLQGFEDEPTVWYTFETGDNVELVDITVNHDGGNVRVAIFEMDNPCEAGNIFVPGGDYDVYCSEGDNEAIFEDLTVKANTIYHIVISSSEDDWGEFTICIEACEPPENFDMCNAEELDFPGLGDYNPDNPIAALNTPGTTECAFGFFNDVDLNNLIDFDCGDDFESAVFYKLNVDPHATKLEIGINVGSAGTVAAQFFVFDGTPDCDGRDFLATINANPPNADHRDCNFTGAANIEIDLCEIDNDLYENLYLWVATSKDDQGTFTLNFSQEIAPINDLCDDPSDPSRAATDFGILNWDDEVCLDDETNRGACPNDFIINGAGACMGNGTFDDEAVVWYEFTTGDNVESVNLEVNHPGSNVRVGLFEMDSPCDFPITVPGDWADYCEQAMGTVEWDQLRVKPNTTYYIMVSTSEDEWGDFSICLSVCEPPENYNICEATELNFPGLGDFDPDDPISFPAPINGNNIDGTTECAYGFWDNEDLSALIHFDCGNQFEHAVFYKLNIDEYATKLRISIDGFTGGQIAAQVFFYDGIPDCDLKGFSGDITIFSEPGHQDCNFTSAQDMELDLCVIDNELYDQMYLWIATNKDDQGEFTLQFHQEVAPLNDLCEDDTSPDREAFNLGTINWEDESGDCNPPGAWWGTQTNRGACPLPFAVVGAGPCMDAFDDEPMVWYEFTTGDNVESIDLIVNHPGSDVRVAVFEMDAPCEFPINIPGDWDEYCDQAFEEVEFEQLRVKPNTTYYIFVSTSEEDWGEFTICISACEPPENYNVCEAEELDFPGLGAYDPDNAAVTTSGTTECGYGFWNDEDLTALIEFNCGDEYEHAAFYKLNIDEFASKIEILIEGTTAGTMSAHVFFWEGLEDCETRDFDITFFMDHGICNFNGTGTIEIDFCPLWADPQWADANLYENMYLWIATNKDDQGEFEIEIFQEIAPYNDDCENAPPRFPGDLGTIQEGDESCLLGETNRGACPILYGGPNACYQGFPDEEEAGVWYEFTTGDEIELISVEIDHSNASTVRMALFQLPDGCGEDGLIVGDIEEYCVEIANGIDSIWNVLVQENTTYYILVSTPIDEWGDFDICVRNCEPPENDKLCDARITPDFNLEPGEEVWNGPNNIDRNEEEFEGTTQCANNFFLDYDLNYEFFDCGPEFESAVFYKINVDPFATEFTLTGFSNGPDNLAFGIFQAAEPCSDDRNYQPEIWFDFEEVIMLDCNAATNGEIIFNLCGFTADERENLYLWVATERKDQGEFEIQLSQKIGPENDDCENAEEILSPGQNILVSDIDEIICLDGTTVWACPEFYDPDDIEDPSNSPQIVECRDEPIEFDFQGVWYSFTTDDEAGRIDVVLTHEGEQDLTFVLFENIGGCDGELIIRVCEISEERDGIIEFENFGIEPNTEYLIMITAPENIEHDFELCINVKPPKICEGDAPYYYNHAEIICGLNALNDFCLLMGPPIMNFSWPGCAFCCAFHNPQWFVFVAGETANQQLSIDVEITECQNNQGAQLALYELDCDVEFDPSGMSEGIQPTEDMLVSDCNLASLPQNGVVNFTVDNVQPGSVYGIVIDGWANDMCKVEVLEVLVGGDPPELDDDELENPIFEEVLLEDTICVGAIGVEFSLESEVSGACTYFWTLEDLQTNEIFEVENEDPVTTVFIDFPEPGDFEICVYATNLCNVTEPACVTVTVVPLDPYFVVDTICKREDYTWIGPFGEVLDVVGPYDIDGDYDFETIAFNEFECVVESFLDLYVIPDNIDNKTPITAVICAGEGFEMPNGEVFTVTGQYGLGDEIFITQNSEPGATFQCDSFFTLDLIVLDVDVFWNDPVCFEGDIILSPNFDVSPNPWFQPGFGGEDIRWQWVRINQFGDPDTIASGGSHIPGDPLDGFLQFDIEEWFENRVEIFEYHVQMTYEGEPDEPCNFIAGSFRIDLDDYFPATPIVSFPPLVCTDNLITMTIEPPFGQFLPDGVDYIWEINTDADDYVIVDDTSGTQYQLIFLVEGTFEICVTAVNECGPSEPNCFEIEVSQPPVSDAGPDDSTCELEYTMQSEGEAGFWTLFSGPTGVTVNYAPSNTDPNATVSVPEYGEYVFVWTEQIAGLQNCSAFDTVTITFNEPPFIVNLDYECDDTEENFVATFDIVGETGPYTVVFGGGTIDSATFTSDTIPDLGEEFVVIMDGNGCVSDTTRLTFRCDCPTRVGVLSATPLQLCDGDCFETDDHYDATNQVYRPGLDTVLYFLQTTNQFSTDPDNWIAANEDGIFCNEDLDINLDQIYYVYVAVGIIDTDTDFIDLDLDDPFNCTRISQAKPIRWRAQPVAEAIDSLAICGEIIQIQAIPSVGVGSWSLVDGPGTITFGDASDPGTEIVAEPCGEYTLRWREDNFVCSDSVDVQVFLNCIPELGNEEFVCDNDDISYSLTFEILPGTQPYQVISPAGYEDAITGNTFFHPAVPNRGETLDTFLIEDANGCLLEVIINANCDCDPDPGVMGPQINLCISQPNVTATVDQPAFSDEPEDIVSFVLHTNSGDQLGDIIAVDADGQFTFDFDLMACGTVYYMSSVIGPPDSTGNVVDFLNGCTRVAPGQPVLWYCEPTVDADDPADICGIEVVTVSGSSTFGTGSWSGGLGEFGNPNSSNTNYTPDSSEIGSTVILTYTTTGTDSICPAVSVDISFFVDEERVADAGPDQVFCDVEPVQLNANSNGEPGVWSGGAGTFNDPSLNNAVYTPDVSEQGQVITLTWTTLAGVACPEMSDEMTIEIVDDLTSVPGEDFIACFLSTELEAELPGNLQGEWSSSDPDVEFDDPNSPVSGVTVPDLGTYCFTWTVSIGDCEDSDEVCVTFVDAPVLVDTILECNDIATEYFVTLIFEGGDEDSYTVNGEPVTGNSFESDWIVSGQQVTFTINDANNCEPFVIDIRHVCECLTEVGVMADPDAVELCEDETFDFSTFYDITDEFLDPNDIRVYLLHDGDRDNVGNIISENTSGVFGFQAGMQTEQSYWVTVAVGDEDGNSGTIDFGDPCLLYSTGVEVIWYDYPDASIETPDILTCAVTEVTITAVTPEADHIEYNWSGPGVVIGQNERTVTVNSVGTYTLEVTDTRANCTSTETITVIGDFEEPTVVIEMPLLLTCARTTVEIDGSGSSSGNFSYEWSGPGIVSGENTPIVTVSEVGTYTLVVTNNDNGCVSEASMTVNEDVEPPVANASVDAELDCSTNQVTISAEGSSQGADFTYQWEGVTGGTNIVSGANEFEAVVSAAGTYRLIVTNNDNGCVSETTVEVIEITDVITGAFVTSSGINCFGDRDGVITVDSVVGGTAPYQYSFEGGAFGSMPQLTNINAGTYSITIRDSRGCLFETSITVTEPPLLEVDLGSNIIVELGEGVTLEAEVSGRDPMDIVDWIWNPQVDPTCPNCPDQVFVPTEETFVEVTVVDSNGCVANASITVFITVTRQVYIPNAFSPNGDGINDFLGVYAGPFRIREIKEFRIFDRWGEQVFHRENIPDPENMLDETNAWDGTFDGEPMDPGVFIYYILIEFADGVEEAFQGDFTLLR